MTRRALVQAFILGAALATLTDSLSAQPSVTRLVYVSALDSGGAPVLNLSPADFRLTEDGAPREVTRVTRGTAPMRIVLMVDSSTQVGPMINNFRTALGAFADTLPESEEVVFVSSGGQIRVRSQAKDDRAKLRAEIARFASEGGANAFVDTMLEADKRFLRTAPGQWPAFVFVTTDNGEGTREPNVDEYNKFMNDFLARGGAAHGVILAGKRIGFVTDIVTNLVDNVGGLRTTIVTDTSLPARLREIAERLADDHQRMLNRYEVAYQGDPKTTTPVIKVSVRRDDVTVEMSTRRPF